MNPLEKLKEYLSNRTIKQASKELLVSRQTIYNWLNGTHSFSWKNYTKLDIHTYSKYGIIRKNEPETSQNSKNPCRNRER